MDSDEEYDEMDEDEEELENSFLEDEEDEVDLGLLDDEQALDDVDALTHFEKVHTEKTHECLSRGDIVKKQEEALKQIQSVTGLPIVYARILLQHYKWDTMKTLNEYTENPDKVCTTAGIPKPDTVKTQKQSNSNDDLTCSICFDEVDDPKDITALECGHKFCSDCWKGYLSLEVKEKKKLIMCPGMNGKVKCPLVVDELTVLRLLDDKEAEKRFIDGLVTSYVEDNPAMKWCPAPGCQYAILLKEVSQDHNEAVSCTCGHTFCFRCNGEEHRPATCQMMADWKKKNTGGDEEMDQQLIATISRPCPKCKVPVEKNGGCNHMHCNKCQFHFCWQCMEKFGSGPSGGSDGYTVHKCNGFYQEDAEVLMKQSELKRFEWYSERYNNHHKSRQQEKNALGVSDTMVASLIDEFRQSWMAAQFYPNALKIIVQNRQTLKSSYVFGYFRPIMMPYVNKNIFEQLQRDLERHTEMLSHMIESKSTKQLWDEATNVVNQTKIAEKVMDSLISAAQDWSNPLDLRSSGNLKKSRSNNKTDPRQAKKGKGQPETQPFDREEAEREIEYNARENARKEVEDRRRRQQREQEEADIQRAIQESKKNTSTPVVDDDWELQLAIQASLAESGTSAPVPEKAKSTLKTSSSSTVTNKPKTRGNKK